MKKSIIPLIVSLLISLPCQAQPKSVGQDVVEAFSRASTGAPLRYVAIGGSITQAGEGWIGDWLRKQFPQSQVTTVNAGISGTGSSLGVFRLDRDVIGFQADIVAIEYCVNDLALPDEDAIRYMESLIVRLKSLPHPPAIIILESATRHGVDLTRHRKVAQHYGLLEVDFQAATDAHLQTSGEPWTKLFSDNVHPNKEGHAVYRDAFEKVLAPLIAEAKKGSPKSAASSLPPPLSTKPLILDGRMVPLQGLRVGSSQWISEQAPQADWSRFFQGMISATEPGAVLQIPFRGTAVGVFFPMNKAYGSFYMNVDGGFPIQVAANTRSGFSSKIASSTLSANEHLLTIVLPLPETPDPDVPPVNGPIKLGYLLIAGETNATREQSPQGPFGIETLKTLQFKPVPASAWSWTGPFAVKADGEKWADARHAMSRGFLGEQGDAAPQRTASQEWRTIDKEGYLVDFRALTGSDEPAITYAEAQITSAQGGPAILALDFDYFAQVWLNGEMILRADGPHPRPEFLQVTLRPGQNSLMCKVGAGSEGFSIQLKVAEAAAPASKDQ